MPHTKYPPQKEKKKNIQFFYKKNNNIKKFSKKQTGYTVSQNSFLGLSAGTWNKWRDWGKSQWNELKSNDIENKNGRK